MERKARVIVVMPAYNAARTLEQTYKDIPEGCCDEIILVDDGSQDRTVELARKLNLVVIRHPENRGYGANQKTCYTEALRRGADIVVMLHPDYQYDPRIIPNIVLPIEQGQADVVLASRFIRDPLLGGPIKGGMPLYKYLANRLLSGLENLALGTYFSEFHTGYRGFSRRALEAVKFHLDSDDFVFDNEILVQLVLKRMRFKEVPVLTRYFHEASTIGFFRAVKYGLGILGVIVRYILHTRGLRRAEQFE